MKRLHTLFRTLLLIFLSLYFFYVSQALAGLTGACDSCHTMHNSQDDQAQATPIQNGLLRSTCAGCHTGDGSDADGLDDTTGAPLVVVTGAVSGNPYDYLPGGYFRSESNGGTDSNYHNVEIVDGDSIKDSGMTDLSPPGYTDLGIGRPADDASWTTKLQCSGTYGCHGDMNEADEAASISGWHHVEDGNFRMLSGINGREDDDAKPNNYDVADNIYYAHANGAAGTDTSTISYFCSQCHGDYHTTANVNSGTAWIRHPTDIQLNVASADDEYDEYGNTVPYTDAVPIGTDSIAAKTGWKDTTFSNGFVICLSCHLAHGGNQPDLMRWDYSGQTAGSDGSTDGDESGCFVCHTFKD